MVTDYVLPREKKVSKWSCRKLEQKTFREISITLESPILEIGPGYGDLMSHLVSLGKTVTGLEYHQPITEELQREGLNVITGDAREMPFPDCSFNAVLIEEVIEHIREQDTVIAEIHRVLKPGGKLLLATPNKYIYRFFMYLSNFKNGKISFALLKNPTLDHVAECTLGKLKEIHSRFRIDQIIPINPYLGKSFLDRNPRLAINFILLGSRSQEPIPREE